MKAYRKHTKQELERVETELKSICETEHQYKDIVSRLNLYIENNKILALTELSNKLKIPIETLKHCIIKLKLNNKYNYDGIPNYPHSVDVYDWYDGWRIRDIWIDQFYS